MPQRMPPCMCVNIQASLRTDWSHSGGGVTRTHLVFSWLWWGPCTWGTSSSWCSNPRTQSNGCTAQTPLWPAGCSRPHSLPSPPLRMLVAAWFYCRRHWDSQGHGLLLTSTWNGFQGNTMWKNLECIITGCLSVLRNQLELNCCDEVVCASTSSYQNSEGWRIMCASISLYQNSEGHKLCVLAHHDIKTVKAVELCILPHYIQFGEGCRTV